MDCGPPSSCVHGIFQARVLEWGAKVTLVMSNSLQPHGLWLTRLLCPWDSPGKNTGVGCHALLREILPYPGIELMSLISPAWQADSVQLSHLGSPKIKLM